MEKWKLYISGICYGDFYKDNNEIYFKWLNPYSLKLDNYKRLDEEANKDLLAFSNLNILELLNLKDVFEKEFIKKPKEIVISKDYKYSLKEDNHYIQRDKILPVDIILRKDEIISFLAPSRESMAILVKEDYEEHTILRDWDLYFPNEDLYKLKNKTNIYIKTRDGEKLSTDIYLPDKEGKLSTILIRTPYGKERNNHMYYRFIHRGYAVVIQDVRGREDSGGEFIPNYHEVEDGDDTLEYLSSLDWSNGNIGMIGGSYLGYVQWAAASSGNEHLKAIVSFVTAGSAFVDIPRRGGCFVSGTLPWAFALSEQNMQAEKMIRNDWDDLMNHRPLQEIPKKGLGKDIPFINMWLENENYDEFWAKGNWYERSSNNEVPALIISGWFDDDGMGTTEALDLTQNYIKDKCKVILGPWNHAANTRYDIHNIEMGTNALRYDLDLIIFRFLDKELNNLNDISDIPPVQYFTRGENKWKSTYTWPIPNKIDTTVYLNQDKTLALDLPSIGQDSYIYDPQNPATHIIDLSENEISVPEDYTQEEKRDDYLCYSTDILEKDITITGDIIVKLYISSDAVDTDFVVRLTHITKDKKSIKLADGLISAKYRDSFTEAKWLEKDKVYEITIRTSKISQKFEKGSQIGFTITSSAKNFIFPNSNTKAGYNSKEYVLAKNTIYYGGNYPSRIILPIEV